MFEHEAWSLILREEKGLRAFEDRVLRRMFGPKRKRKVVTGDWRKLQVVEFHNLHSSSNIIGMIKTRRMSWAEDVAHLGRFRNTSKILIIKCEGKRTFGKMRIN
jgi:hypothetical protein